MVNADHLYSCDQHWWHHHIHDINMGFTGKRWSCEPYSNSNWGKRDPTEWGVTVLRCDVAGTGLSTDPEVLIGGGNSGYQAIGLALHLGAQRIILLGYDMTWTGGKSHWFGDHPTKFNKTNPERYISGFRTIRPSDYGLEIINCSRSTALDAFPVRSLDGVFN